MKDEENGRVKLTWPQVVWAVAMIATVLGAWFNLGGKLDLLRQEVAQMEKALVHLSLLEHEHAILPGHAGVMSRVDEQERRMDRLERREQKP